MTGFEGMTSDQLEDWMLNVRPGLVRMQEQVRERARQSALEMIRRPYPSREELNWTTEEADRGRT